MNEGMQTFQYGLFMLPAESQHHINNNKNNEEEEDDDEANNSYNHNYNNEASEEEEWDLQDEARTCALIHLAFVIRSTYYIWDHSLAESAHLMLMASSVPPYTIIDPQVQNGMMQAEISEIAMTGTVPTYAMKPRSPTPGNRFEAPLQLP